MPIDSRTNLQPVGNTDREYGTLHIERPGCRAWPLFTRRDLCPRCIVDKYPVSENVLYDYIPSGTQNLVDLVDGTKVQQSCKRRIHCQLKIGCRASALVRCRDGVNIARSRS